MVIDNIYGNALQIAIAIYLSLTRWRWWHSIIPRGLALIKTKPGQVGSNDFSLTAADRNDDRAVCQVAIFPPTMPMCLWGDPRYVISRLCPRDGASYIMAHQARLSPRFLPPASIPVEKKITFGWRMQHGNTYIELFVD